MVMINVAGRIVLVNAQTERMFGYSRAEMLEQSVEMLIPERLRGSHNIFFAGPCNRKMGIGCELYGRRQDGSEFPVEICINPIDTPTGPAVLSSIVDTTERMEKRLLEERFIEVQRKALAMRSALLATMSHELRTPLAGIIGTIDMLQQQQLHSPDLEFVSLVSTISCCSNALLDIINDILDFSKLEAGGVQLEHISFQPRALLQEVVSILSSPLSAKGLVMTMTVDDTVPVEVIGDPGRLRQVILNLCSNALKFTPRGSVNLQMDYMPETSPSAPRLTIRVRDTGLGIPPEIQDKLFQPFIQADSSTTREYGGTGLGLSISKMLVELMHGSIQVKSKPGVGSCFTFDVAVAPMQPSPISSQEAIPAPPSLPVLSAASAAAVHSPTDSTTLSKASSSSSASSYSPAAAPSVAVGCDLLGLRVLLADDNIINQKVVRAMLKYLGCTTVAVSNGAEAVAAMAREAFDVVLMDCEMPVMDGFAATRELRKSGVTVRIVAMTANAMMGDRERCLQHGMDDYLSKPVRLAVLKACLANWTHHI